MLTSWLDGEIVWLKMDGVFIADELIAETGKWLRERPDDFVGYILDIRAMTERNVLEQEKAEQAARKNQSGKVRAVLGKGAALGILVNLHIRVTRAQGVRYFTNEEDAKAWVMSFKKKNG